MQEKQKHLTKQLNRSFTRTNTIGRREDLWKGKTAFVRCNTQAARYFFIIMKNLQLHCNVASGLFNSQYKHSLQTSRRQLLIYCKGETRFDLWKFWPSYIHVTIGLLHGKEFTPPMWDMMSGEFSVSSCSFNFGCTTEREIYQIRQGSHSKR